MTDTGQVLYTILKELERESSRIGKHKILLKYKNIEALSLMLFYAYNPFLRYHIRNVPTNLKSKSNATIDRKTWSILTQLSKRTITGLAGKRYVFHYIQSLTPQAAYVFVRILKKNLSCGINMKSINKAIPNLLPDHSVMKPFDYQIDKLSESFFISPKIDGIRATFRKGKLHFRNGKEVLGVTHITSLLNPMVEYDGELKVPGVDFDTGSGLIRSHAKAKPNVVYHVFDNISLGRQPLNRRLSSLAMLPVTNCIKRVPHALNSDYKALDVFYKNARQLGFEGIVIKDAYSLYERKRSWAWMRIKPNEDAEFKILNVFEGEGKYTGALGGVVIRVGRRTQKVGGGFSDDQRVMWWARPAQIIGRKATVKFMEYTDKGGLRHPEFKAIRWDITP